MSRLRRSFPVARTILLFALLGLMTVCLGGLTDASAADTGTEAKVVKELVEKRTENSKTYLLSDGHNLCEIYSVPMNYRDATGAWQEIDTTLVPGEALGSYHTKAAPSKVTLSPAAAGGSVAALEYQGSKVGMSAPRGVSLVGPAASESAGLFSSRDVPVNIVYEAMGGAGLKETIVLKNQKAPSTYTYTLEHPGLFLRQDLVTGEWGFRTDPDDLPVIVLGGLSVWDSTVDRTGSTPTARTR